MKKINCASLIALVAGGLAAATPATAAPSSFALNPTSINANHNMLTAASLSGEDIVGGPLSHQQQQQQQRRSLVAEAGIIYGAPLTGFSV